jgi:pantoate--beta-alanine ligase
MNKPIVINSIREFKSVRKGFGTQVKVGFVPTMGYLHEGHLSLVKQARKENDIVVVSIYVNPTQFGANEDLDAYPTDIERDIALLTECNADYVFIPNSVQMYPKNYQTYVNVTTLTQNLCGASRPTHFQGVTTIVTKLINIVKPDSMYMGEKDFQQVTVIARMVEDLNMDVNVISCPIIRESDGLAMSSRNTYLSSEERKNALCLYKSILLTKELFSKGETNPKLILEEIEKLISNNHGIIDYIEFVSNRTLQPVDVLNTETRIALAVKIGKTRLIDNMLIN